jgi:predicted ATPase/class 3 adenylate cyclase
MGDEVRPSGVVTFLFTDIEGSTRRWETDADAMRDALAAHDETLRAAIESHEGWLFKHTGDGVCAAFVSPGEAVEAAIDAQRALELPVRMGIATGEAELREGDYFGPALNRAARVMGAGHGGQILLVDTTATLVRDVELVDLGPRRLRDLSEPVGVFQVRGEGLVVKFPPLRTLDATPGNLKPQRDSFVGREAEVVELEAALGTHRLVTLTGVGGVGKTRLAVQVAAELAPEFPEGVFVVELASVGDPDAVDDAVAGVLGIVQQPGLSVAESVGAALEGRYRLLVLDNCEHVLDAAAGLVDEIFARSETVKVLATSREGLRVAGEHVWTVPSLGTSAGAGSEGVALFVDRAQSLVQGFSLDNGGDADAVVEICRRLDGIPLAIELAASRMASMTPSDVRDRLDDRFRLLAGSRRGLERHQTLRHAVQWSYDLLDDHERDVLDRCSVFAGGFNLDAAVAVAGGGLDEYAVLDLLDSLVRKSMLVADRSTGHARYAMLETIRQFAEDQLAAAGAAIDTHNAHARFYTAQQEPVLTLWRSARQRDAYDWFHAELANLRTAFRWAADNGDLDTAATIAVYATHPLGRNTAQHEPSTWAEELIEAAVAENHPKLVCLYAAATECARSGRLTDGVAYGDAGIALVDNPHFDDLPYASARLWLADSHINAAQPDTAIAQAEAHLALGLPDEVIARAALTQGLEIAGRTDEALAAAQGLVEAAEATSNPASLCGALMAEGWVSRHTDPARTIELTRRGLTLAQDSGNKDLEGTLAMFLGEAEFEIGDTRSALDHLSHALRMYNNAGTTAYVSGPVSLLAQLLPQLGAHEPAAVLAAWPSAFPTAELVFPLSATIDELRHVLGDHDYDALAARGAAMTRAEIARFADAQIDQLSATLETT